jgi:hypothetical protein
LCSALSITQWRLNCAASVRTASWVVRRRNFDGSAQAAWVWGAAIAERCSRASTHRLPDCSIVFLAQNWGLYCVNNFGNLRWFFPMPSGSSPDGSPAVAEDGTIYIGSAGGYGNAYVYAINSSGGLEWVFDTGGTGAFNSSPAIGSDSTIYAASTHGQLWAISNGGLLWGFTNASGAKFRSSPAVTADNQVIIGSDDSWVYGISNGVAAWSSETGGPVISSAAINPVTGAVVIASYDGTVYQMPGSASLAADTDWPIFRQNARRSGAAPNASCSGADVATAYPNNPLFSISGAQTNFQFNVSGTPGTGWLILTSSNLTDWTAIATVALDPMYGYYGPWTDTNAADFTNRFYVLQSGSGASCSQIMGFINLAIPPGTSLIANQLCQVNDYQYPQNTADALAAGSRRPRRPERERAFCLFPDKKGSNCSFWPLPCQKNAPFATRVSSTSA